MPHSDTEGKDWALQAYLNIKPNTVIDIGAGSGTYARLMRPHCKSHWAGVEAWAPYVAEYGLEELYDTVHVGDARMVDWSGTGDGPDLVILGDVLEHMKAYEADDLLRQLKEFSGNLLVSIPILHLDQGAVNGNPFERHVDHWTYEAMLNELGPGVVDTWRGDVLAYYWWRRS